MALIGCLLPSLIHQHYISFLFPFNTLSSLSVVLPSLHELTTLFPFLSVNILFSTLFWFYNWKLPAADSLISVSHSLRLAFYLFPDYIGHFFFLLSLAWIGRRERSGFQAYFSVSFFKRCI